MASKEQRIADGRTCGLGLILLLQLLDAKLGGRSAQMRIETAAALDAIY